MPGGTDTALTHTQHCRQEGRQAGEEERGGLGWDGCGWNQVMRRHAGSDLWPEHDPSVHLAGQTSDRSGQTLHGAEGTEPADRRKRYMSAASTAVTTLMHGQHGSAQVCRTGHRQDMHGVLRTESHRRKECKVAELHVLLRSEQMNERRG